MLKLLIELFVFFLGTAELPSPNNLIENILQPLSKFEQLQQFAIHLRPLLRYVSLNLRISASNFAYMYRVNILKEFVPEVGPTV